MTDDLPVCYYSNFTSKFFLKSSSLFYKLENRDLGMLSNVSKVTQQVNVELKFNSLSILLLSFYLHTIAFQNKDIKWEIKGNTIILKLYSWRMGVLSVEHKARMIFLKKRKRMKCWHNFSLLVSNIYIYNFLQHFTKIYLTMNVWELSWGLNSYNNGMKLHIWVRVLVREIILPE